MAETICVAIVQWTETLSPPRLRLCDQVGLPVIVSVCSITQKVIHMDLHDFLSKVDLSPALRRLHLGCDPDWPSLSFRGHSRPARSFRLKIDCSRRNGKRYSQRYYIALIGSRMYSVQWRHPRWPCSSFQGQTRRRYVAPWKTISRETYVCGSGRQQWCPTCFLPRVQLSSWDFGLGGGLRSLMCWLRDLNLCYFNPLDSRGNYSATWNNTN